MIGRVTSGGQSGADQAGWRAARLFAIPTGGWMPARFWTEYGDRPDFAPTYGAKDIGVGGAEGLRLRTDRNVAEADAVLLFGDANSAGSRCTLSACRRHGKPVLHVGPGMRPSAAVEWLRDLAPIRTLMIAGNRESTDPGIGARVERFLRSVFLQLGYVSGHKAS